MNDTMPRLTPKQHAFVLAYAACGNSTEAARQAGYKKPNQAGPRMLVNVGISGAIDKLRRASEEAAIATSQERQRFWTAIMRDPSQSPRDRLKASELLGKAQGDFIIRHEINEPMQLIIYLPDNGRDPRPNPIACIDSPAQLGG